MAFSAYFERRSTTEDVQQPHSLELQVLSELGVVGALLLACVLVGAGWGASRMHRRAARYALWRALMVGALGMFAAWLVNHDESLGRFWLVRVPSAQVSSKSTAASPCGATANQTRLERRTKCKRFIKTNMPPRRLPLEHQPKKSA